jgi:hypothetical protein
MLCGAGSTASDSAEVRRKMDCAGTVRTSSVAVILLAGLRTVVIGAATAVGLFTILYGEVFVAAAWLAGGASFNETAALAGAETGFI